MCVYLWCGSLLQPMHFDFSTKGLYMNGEHGINTHNSDVNGLV